MLKQTFIHLPGINGNAERKFWSAGVKSWDDFTFRFGRRTGIEWEKLNTELSAGQDALKLSDALYFAQRLPLQEHWRALSDFGKIAYVDIETTGLDRRADKITVIGLYDGKNVRSYVNGRNLRDFTEDIRGFDAIITFNGNRFDLPFILAKFPEIIFPPLRIDLCLLFRTLGIRGGLKKIEQDFSLVRDDSIRGMDGLAAVRLWREYERSGSEKALESLIEYNSADIVSLKILQEKAYDKKRKGIMEV